MKSAIIKLMIKSFNSDQQNSSNQKYIIGFLVALIVIISLLLTTIIVKNTTQRTSPSADFENVNQFESKKAVSLPTLDRYRASLPQELAELYSFELTDDESAILIKIADSRFLEDCSCGCLNLNGRVGKIHLLDNGEVIPEGETSSVAMLSEINTKYVALADGRYAWVEFASSDQCQEDCESCTSLFSSDSSEPPAWAKLSAKRIIEESPAKIELMLRELQAKSLN